jgi:hypothetical protein
MLELDMLLQRPLRAIELFTKLHLAFEFLLYLLRTPARPLGLLLIRNLVVLGRLFFPALPQFILNEFVKYF